MIVSTGMNREQGGQGRQHRNSHPQNTISSQFFNQFGALGINMAGFNDLFSVGQTGGAEFTSFSSLSNFSGPSGGGAVKRTSTSTRFISGKKITTKK